MRNIFFDLFDEGFFGVEGRDITDLFDEADFDGLAVEISVKVEQMRFDDGVWIRKGFARADEDGAGEEERGWRIGGLEFGVWSVWFSVIRSRIVDFRRWPVDSCPRRIDAVGGDELVLGFDVGGGEAELTPYFFAMNDRAEDREGTTETFFSQRDVALSNRVSDEGARYFFSVTLNVRYRGDGEVVLGSKLFEQL